MYENAEKVNTLDKSNERKIMDGLIADIKSKLRRLSISSQKNTSKQKTDQVAFSILKANALKRKSNQDKQDIKQLENLISLLEEEEERNKCKQLNFISLCPV